MEDACESRNVAPSPVIMPAMVPATIPATVLVRVGESSGDLTTHPPFCLYGAGESLWFHGFSVDCETDFSRVPLCKGEQEGLRRIHLNDMCMDDTMKAEERSIEWHDGGGSTHADGMARPCDSRKESSCATAEGRSAKRKSNI